MAEGIVMVPLVLALVAVVGEPGVDRLRAHVAALASDSMEGRGLGTLGISRAAAYLSRELDALGLQAAPPWAGGDTVRGGERPVVNLVRSWGREPYLVLCAHYDHLGVGRDGVYLGAHDNASGVAVVLEASRVLKTTLGHGFLVCLFSGEEDGLVGSRALASRIPPGEVKAALCVDAVGHLDSTLLLMGDRQLGDLVGRVGAAMGLRTAEGPWGGSDHASFLEAGIPAVGLSTGPHPLMNTPGDAPHTLDYEGMRRVVQVVVSALHEFAALPIRRAAPGPPVGEGMRRRVRLGTIPDLSFGSGYRVEGVVADSPAWRAGIREGDLVEGVDGLPVGNARDLAQILAARAPGDTVVVRVRRGSEVFEVPCVLEEVPWSSTSGGWP